MRIFPRRHLLALGLGGVLIAGLLGGATVLAQEPEPGDDSTTEDSRPHHRWPRLFTGLKGIVAESGLEPSVFREGFAEGQTVAEILEQNGLDPAEVKAAVLAKAQEKLDALVEEGKLDAEQAAQMLERISNALDTILESSGPGGDRPGRPFHARPNFLVAAAETIGIEVSELLAGIRDGSTVAEVADANGVAPETVIAALVEQANARIDEHAASRGLDDEAVAELKLKAEERITAFVDGTFEPPFRQGPFGPGRPQGFPLGERIGS